MITPTSRNSHRVSSADNGHHFFDSSFSSLSSTNILLDDIDYPNLIDPTHSDRDELFFEHLRLEPDPLSIGVPREGSIISFPSKTMEDYSSKSSSESSDSPMRKPTRRLSPAVCNLDVNFGDFDATVDKQISPLRSKESCPDKSPLRKPVRRNSPILDENFPLLAGDETLDCSKVMKKPVRSRSPSASKRSVHVQMIQCDEIREEKVSNRHHRNNHQQRKGKGSAPLKKPTRSPSPPPYKRERTIMRDDEVPKKEVEKRKEKYSNKIASVEQSTGAKEQKRKKDAESNRRSHSTPTSPKRTNHVSEGKKVSPKVHKGSIRSFPMNLTRSPGNDSH